MASRTAWTSGNLTGNGLGWTKAFNDADINASSSGNGLANGATVLSGVADWANGTGLDMFMDISYRFTISSNTIGSGASIVFFAYYLNQDGTAYGDNQLTAGTGAAITPAMPPVVSMGIPAVASTTNMYGIAEGIQIFPGSFRLALQNNSGFAFSNTIGSQIVKIRTYNIQLNN